MNCQRAIELLTGPADAGTSDERASASQHMSHCADCRSAIEAVHALRLASLAPMPKAPDGAFERAMAAATRQTAVKRSTRPFWLGVGVGGAMAASLLIAALIVGSILRTPSATLTPELSLALNQLQTVNIALTTEQALDDAEIHVVLRGAVDLDGYAGQRELSWFADLDAGTNQLALPVIATGVEGGQVLVEVIHEGKRRSFLVDVKARI